MSSAGKWSYTEVITVWPAGSENVYGDITFGAPYTIVGSWERGSTMARDAEGNEFVPDSVYYFELERDAAQQPTIGDFIVLGDETANSSPVSDAEQIRAVTVWGAEMFGSSELPDWKIMT